mgnify:FL=1
MILSSFKTAKYNREREMKEIHLNFHFFQEQLNNSIIFGNRKIQSRARNEINSSYKIHFFRNNIMISSSFKTAKYNREQEMREIHLIKLFF